MVGIQAAMNVLANARVKVTREVVEENANEGVGPIKRSGQHGQWLFDPVALVKFYRNPPRPSVQTRPEVKTTSQEAPQTKQRGRPAKKEATGFGQPKTGKAPKETKEKPTED